jgi:hypothetical protein
MTEAIIYRARMMGADAVIILPPNQYQETVGAFSGGRCVFRGEAVVFTTTNN